jgi:regulator of sigma D
MPNSAVFPKIGAALGAIVSPMPLSEVFTALEQKVVDGQDNPIGLLRANGFFEVQTHVLESYHVFTPNVLIINKKIWDKLSPNQQKVLQDAAKAYADYQWELSEKSYEEDKKFLTSKGIQFITPDAAFKKQMEEAMKANNAEIEQVNQQMVDLMVNDELQSFNRNGKMFYLTTKIYASAVLERKPELFSYLKDNGFGDMVQEQVNAQTLAAWVREQIADTEDEQLPEGVRDLVNVSPKTQVAMKKAGRAT